MEDSSSKEDGTDNIEDTGVIEGDKLLNFCALIFS